MDDKTKRLMNEFARQQANGAEQSESTCNLQNVNVRSSGTVVHFLMQKGSAEETVHFDGNPSYNYIDSYFETKCGGVYKWWI